MTRFEVRITGEERAEIGGQPLVPEPGQCVRDAVLDRLQQFARERAATVAATVDDGSGAAGFLVQVSPDGSSRVLGPGTAQVRPVPDRPEPCEPPKSPEAGPVPEPGPAPVSAVTTGGGARATADAPVLPAEHAERIGRINALAAGGRLQEACADASALREDLAGSLGPGHPHALEARAVEAYLAHLRGDHREATVLALGVARIRCGARDGRASAEVARAAAAWQRIDDDRAALVHGRELLHMWDRLLRVGLLPPRDTALVGQVRRRVDALAARV
ncbi:hypothetical protein [Streptomyces anandii]|uniref:hypothetical protein n=1 Tax=Streptomyces anandii TaxID=285454 RepID=UPI00167B4FFA|nr:hypothetical protein [Streptomyces anandii]GGY10081.1 hypothetical protein GCM10010510_65130 [Streptomyces anandii JCM 4720]